MPLILANKEAKPYTAAITLNLLSDRLYYNKKL